MHSVEQALILHYADWGERDRMVTLFSPRRGRIDAVARGCRRAKSPLMNATEIFTSGEYTLFEKGGRISIEQCRITESFYPLRTELDRLTHGIYWLRLLDATVQPDIPARDLFTMSLKALAWLAYTDLDPAILTLSFEIRLMDLEGIAPRVDACARCGQALEDEAGFDALHGGCVCKKCAPTAKPISYGARRILYRLPRTPFESTEKLKGHPDLEQAERFCRTFLKGQINLRADLWP